MQRRSFLAATTATIAAIAAPAVLAQNGKLTPLKFTLDFRINGQTAPFFLALAKGYYKDEGLDVSIDTGAGSVASITRIASGVYQLGLGDISSLVEFNAQNPGTPMVQAVYQYYNRAPFAIIGRKDRGVTGDFRSLAGKKVAAAAVESTRRAWPLVARKQGMRADAFQWQTTDFSARDNVMVRGDVDAATYFHDSAVSLFARMKPEELSVLKYADAGVNLYGNAILAGSNLIAQNPKVVAAFLRASNRAIVETFANPAPSIAAMRQREPILDEKIELERWGITAQYVGAPDTQGHGLGDIRKLTLEQQVDEVADVFGLKVKPASDAIFNTSMLPSRSERTLPKSSKA
ncbi:ABC transporter substrate-binding protein [Variovorax sp. 375MFSha3.1]|uniref:ABC transporter substrate-binding protein n=1 Tax=unclassified Variovorax TaxID=663243 RepID=UPI003AACA8FF